MSSPSIPYKKGDFIGQKYQVYGVLGQGGFGVVYLVYSHEATNVYALKTFRDEYLEDAEARELFRKEAEVWVDLERHPYLVRAYFVDEVAGRLYIAMEHIPPNEQGLNSLEGYLEREPPDLTQSLRWAIQFCYGMEYAYSRGLRCHRDIKPSNIMISTDKTVKISDFGLASVLHTSRMTPRTKLNLRQGKIGLSIMDGRGCGTPTHMSPEQFIDAASCDERSDIYAFGIVLYQMATGGTLPFLASKPIDDSEEEMRRFCMAMYRLHSEAAVPRLDSPLFPVIQRCLEKELEKRYKTVKQLRTDLELLLKRQTGEIVKPPEPKGLEAWEWGNKGVSLDRLGRMDEAVRCFDRAIEINPQYAEAWSSKGVSHDKLGRLDEAIKCYDKALEINPQFINAWNNRGNTLNKLGCFDEAIRCFGKAIEINPQYAVVWNNKGNSLNRLRRFGEAIQCYDKALQIDPQYADAWNNKGNSLNNLGRFDEAIKCIDTALKINPQFAGAWSNKGNSFNKLGHLDEAIRHYDKAIEIDPQLAEAWYNKGFSLFSLRRFEESESCFDKAVEINPQFAEAWDRKGFCLAFWGSSEEAISCFNKAIEINPQLAEAWYDKALVEDLRGRRWDAARFYRKFIELASAQYARQVEYALQRIRELEKK